jgi:hypothetical protein
MKKSIAERLKGKIMMMIIEGNRNVEGATIDPIQTIQANQAHQTEGAGIGKLEKIKGVLIMGLIILTIQNKQITTKIIPKIIQISEICMIIYNELNK